MLSFIALGTKAQIYTTVSSPQETEQRFGLADTAQITTETFYALTDAQLQALAIEDSISEYNNQPYRFAKLIDTDLTTENSGVWSTTATYLIWKLEIYAAGAKSLSLTFQDLSFPTGAEIYLVSGDKELVCGPMDEENFPQLEEISTEVFAGERLIVYYAEPIEVGGERNIHIKYIGYGYRGGDGSSLACNEDVTDTFGDCFRMEQRGVAKLLRDNSTALCTGSLINNTG